VTDSTEARDAFATFINPPEDPDPEPAASATPGTPKPDPSQGAKGTAQAVSAREAFSRFINGRS
jgi:hypothetical protein